jgi:hypothetical protein
VDRFHKGEFVYRRFALLAASAALALPATGCQSDNEAAATDRVWFDTATTDAQRWELMRRIREVDPCALVPRATLEEHGAVREVHLGGPVITGCAASLDQGADQPTSIKWSLVKAPPSSAVDETRRVGDVAVEILEPGGTDSGGDLSNCWVTAQFPSLVQIFLTVKAAPTVDTCALGDSLIDTAIAQLPASPAYGTSPDSVRTALTGADPCEILPRIGAEPLLPVDDYQTVPICRFGSGVPTGIEYGYQADGEIRRDETITIHGRPVFVGRLAGSGHVGYTFVVGPAITRDIFPIITVLGANQAEVEAARDALMAKYPAP